MTKEQEDRDFIEKLAREIKKVDQKIEIEIERRDFDDYSWIS